MNFQSRKLAYQSRGAIKTPAFKLGIAPSGKFALYLVFVSVLLPALLSACVPAPYQDSTKPKEPIETDTAGIDTSNIEGATVDILEEGATETYTMSGIEYDITLDFVGSSSAKFTVNGQVTPALGKGDSFTLLNGVEIVLRDTFAGEGPRMAEFMLVKYK
ncbi:hypothetical protein HYV81_02615 [Candidatus Woesearchaeota archaeon]|nr:hypothetical protein [Candidatus Woesearchaeota archaeon]